MSGNVPSLTERNPVRIMQAIRDLFAGRSNAVGTCTLTANAASTVVTATNCGADSKVFLTPTTANAAAEIGNGTLRVSAVAGGSFTLSHANNAQNDRTYYWGAFG
jgi:dihydrodipicolinate synthase/N-acetylneuraminate lyase